MKTFTTTNYGRTIIIHLGKGELILESVKREIDRLGIRNGILLSAIGSLRKATLHVITNTNELSVNRYITIEKPIELGAAQGIIIDGEPHFHLTISEPENMYAGHMEPGCEVQYLAELAILELKDLNVTRKLDEFGISYIDTI
jgi:predicted DNA-binding protein with PD1-like motif